MGENLEVTKFSILYPLAVGTNSPTGHPNPTVNILTRAFMGQMHVNSIAPSQIHIHSQSSTVSTVKYKLFSLPTIMKLCEIILSFVLLFLVGIFCDRRECSFLGHYGVQGWIFFTDMVILLMTIILLTMHILLLQERCSKFDWLCTEFIFNVIAAILCVINATIESLYAHGFTHESIYSQWIAAAVFCWLLFILYFAETVIFCLVAK